MSANLKVEVQLEYSHLFLKGRFAMGPALAWLCFAASLCMQTSAFNALPSYAHKHKRARLTTPQAQEKGEAEAGNETATAVAAVVAAAGAVAATTIDPLLDGAALTAAGAGSADVGAALTAAGAGSAADVVASFAAVVVAAALSATLWLLFLVSRLAAPHRILEEATKPRSFFPYGAWEMAFAFSWARLLPAHCEFGAYAAGLLQLIILMVFLRACWKDGAAPEPYWNPVCMSCAATTIVAAPCLGARHWLPMGSFGLALVTLSLIHI